jgi:5-methylthioadenosine/S-adenosylhomocysteine deaminase
MSDKGDTSVRTLIQGGWVVGYKDTTHVLFRDGVVVFEGDKIIHVGSHFDGPVDRSIDAKGKLVSPGFIDTHVHSGHLAPLRLITDVGRPDYFGQPFFEFTTPRQGTMIGGDPRYVTSDQTSSGVKDVWAQFTVVELLRNGTTTFVEFGARAHVQQSLADALGNLGIRCYLGAGFNIGRWVGGEGGKLVRIIDLEYGRKIFDEAVEFVKQIDGQYNERARGMLVPTGVEMCSLEQMRDTARLSRELDVPVAIHAAYSVLEFMDVVREHQMTPIELLENVGLLGLVLLRQQALRRGRLGVGAVQQGHRESFRASATINRLRMVAIEFGMWRSGRNGGSPGSVTIGYGRFRELYAGTRC